MIILGALSVGSLIGWSFKPNTIVVVDMQRLLNQPAVLLSQSHLSTVVQKNILKRYSSLLPNTLKEYGQLHKVTLITATVIHSEHDDVTDEVISMALDRLKTS